MVYLNLHEISFLKVMGKKLKSSIYLNKQCRISTENQKVLSPDTLDIFLPEDFSSLQRANLSDISQQLKVVRLHHL